MPLPSTMTPIATQTLASAAASVTFSSIPQGYTDLVLIANYGLTTNLSNTILRVNSDSGVNYSNTAVYGSGSAAGSTRDTSVTEARIMEFANNTGSQMWIQNIINVMNYANTTTYKSILVRDSMPNRGTSAIVNLWRNTAAITSITISAATGTMDANSTFTLYGVKAA